MVYNPQLKCHRISHVTRVINRYAGIEIYMILIMWNMFSHADPIIDLNEGGCYYTTTYIKPKY